MPLVRIDLVTGRSAEQIRAIADAIHESIVAEYGIPSRDRFQIVTEHRPARSSRRMPGSASSAAPAWS
jgi:phenylpyruvate tautomerase PptA (4-oxalocrotonate tautomerase family)